MILGCGHSESMTLYNNNAAVLSDSGNILIDCGHTIKHALHDQGMSIADVDAIYISHVHGDHVFGLERIAYEAKFKYKKRIKLIFHSSIMTELWDQTLKGSLGTHGDGEATLQDYYDVTALDDDKFSLFGNDYQLVPVEHTPNKSAYGLLINNKLFYSTDTIAIPGVIKSLDFETGFHDVTLTKSNPVHATLDSLIQQYPEEVRKKLYLMSYEDDWHEYVDIVGREFAGFAKQGMKIEF